MSAKRARASVCLVIASGVSASGCGIVVEIAEQMDVELVPEYRPPATTTMPEKIDDILFEDGSGFYNGKVFCIDTKHIGGCSPIEGEASAEQIEWFFFDYSDGEWDGRGADSPPEDGPAEEDPLERADEAQS